MGADISAFQTHLLAVFKECTHACTHTQTHRCRCMLWYTKCTREGVFFSFCVFFFFVVSFDNEKLTRKHKMQLFETCSRDDRCVDKQQTNSQKRAHTHTLMSQKSCAHTHRHCYLPPPTDSHSSRCCRHTRLPSSSFN